MISEKEASGLSFVKIFSQEDPESGYNSYADVMGDRNPFFPMLEGMQYTLLDRDQVLKTFRQAGVLYRNVLARGEEKEEKEAQDREFWPRLYRMQDIGTSNGPYKAKAVSCITKDFAGNTAKQITEKITRMTESTDIVTQRVGNLLDKYKDKVYEICEKPDLIVSKNKRKPFLETLEKELHEINEPLFFKTNRDKEYLRKISSVYNPEKEHSWGTNLAWMLAHIRKSNTFIVCSSIVEANKYRTGKAYKNLELPCAFAREVCVALKAGYILEKNEDGSVFLRPPSVVTMENLDTNGCLGNGINPSYEEIKQVFSYLESVKDNYKRCLYSFVFQIIEDGSKEEISIIGSESNHTTVCIRTSIPQKVDESGCHTGISSSSSSSSETSSGQQVIDVSTSFTSSP